MLLWFNVAWTMFRSTRNKQPTQQSAILSKRNLKTKSNTNEERNVDSMNCQIVNFNSELSFTSCCDYNEAPVK